VHHLRVLRVTVDSCTSQEFDSRDQKPWNVSNPLPVGQLFLGRDSGDKLRVCRVFDLSPVPLESPETHAVFGACRLVASDSRLDNHPSGPVVALVAGHGVGALDWCRPSPRRVQAAGHRRIARA